MAKKYADISAIPPPKKPEESSAFSRAKKGDNFRLRGAICDTSEIKDQQNDYGQEAKTTIL